MPTVSSEVRDAVCKGHPSSEVAGTTICIDSGMLTEEFLQSTDDMDLTVIMSHDGISAAARSSLGEECLPTLDSAARLLLGHRPRSVALYTLRPENPVVMDVAHIHHLGFRRIMFCLDPDAAGWDCTALEYSMMKILDIFDDTEFLIEMSFGCGSDHTSADTDVLHGQGSIYDAWNTVAKVCGGA